MESTVTRVPLGGVLIAYRDSGPSTVPHPLADVPVLLVHGMGGDGHTWDRFAHRLVRSGRRVIIPDLRGHGRSAHTDSYRFDEFGADLLRLCDRLELTAVDLVGHSLGGYAVSCVAIERPDLVRRLVIEEQPLPLRSGDERVTLTRRFPTVPELWHATTSLIRHPRAVLAFDRSMTRTALEQFRKPNPEWWERLPDIAAPTLMLRGGPGGMVDPEKLELFRTSVPDCAVAAFDCGHSIHRDRYREFTTAVLPFLGHP
ncbi:alpha/beta hydrolase [Nocardia terpenica]|uniref:alpha/beta fold hydrolase n=1 Tax=Nocardia terpenica TaxID=455432 RepID=UPI0018959913|nr:alpha/beta hydrolase [Nocardia terpenica]MBF6061804.1 alpha/beta hydrolase [Nocardia terpenica]MBF6106395.1 alpha/beta hydrolase [Nocardia terpenica]MBF6110224.1 alpha/beta hydrolase [Nocardia terpenica]MBF6120939.1 alpha/beta hydrolase [Nocardia terpenica]MBF6151560.1 alpha/beta hydrolase [Nocardia terpenica]